MNSTELSKKISGCFGEFDVLFARHQLDKDRAKALKKALKDSALTSSEIHDAFLKHMTDNNCSESHISFELKLIRKMFK